jgi:hypothetical protein
VRRGAPDGLAAPTCERKIAEFVACHVVAFELLYLLHWTFPVILEKKKKVGREKALIVGFWANLKNLK